MMLLMLLALLTFVAVAAIQMATSPIGRHRGARRLAPADTEHRGPARHRR